MHGSETDVLSRYLLLLVVNLLSYVEVNGAGMFLFKYVLTTNDS